MIFDVLKPDLDVHKSHFVEASAGCGKTFSIENIVVRLVMDLKKPIDIERILVLTFTKEATSELKSRIRKSLESAKRALQDPLESSFEYIKVFAFKPKEERDQAIFLLNEALIRFDLSQIFTIHKFCYAQLKKFLFEANLNLLEDPEKISPSLKFYEGVVRDYLGFYYQQERFDPQQIKLLLSYYKNDFSHMVQSIVSQLAKEVSFSSVLTCRELESFLKKEGLDLDFCSEEELAKMYLSAAPLFKGAANIKKELLSPVVEAVLAFSKLASEKKVSPFLKHAQTFIQIFNSKNVKKSAEALKQKHQLFFAFHSKVEETLFPLILQVSQKENLLALVGLECQKIVNQIFEEKRILTPNNILFKFKNLIKNQSVADKIQSEYGAVIVDEFQDTDPLQWDILSSIFLKSRAVPIYLVGDPKQSIYGFRRADIYTYLKASKMLGVSNISTLQVNYRSQPGLILALNALFTLKKDRWLSLPQLNSFLSYQPVLSFDQIQKKDFKDDKGSMHVMVCHQEEKNQRVPSLHLEEKQLFPFILNEILRFHKELKCPLCSFAVLVRDRYQGARFKSFLKKFKLSFMSTRPESLQGLATVRSFLEIYKAVLYPKKESYIFALKLSPILNLSSSLFETQMPLFIKWFIHLRELLFKKGFLAFYHALTCENYFFDVPLYEQILSQETGLYTYLELEQIKDLLSLKEKEGDNPFHLQKHLQDLSDPFALTDQAYPLRQNFEEDGVQILTLHMSKGLEFEVVFALGLINQGKAYSDLVLDPKRNEIVPLSSKTSQEQEMLFEEEDAEKLRQLYVAMTRAKQRLYVPVVFTEKKGSQKARSAMELLLDRLDLDEEGLKSFIDQHQEISFSVLEKQVRVEHGYSQEKVKLVSPSLRQRLFLSEYMHSFSSLAKSKETLLVDLKAPHDFSNPEKNLHTLPAGASTGVLIHHILEKIDFGDPKVEPYLVNTPFWPWRNEIEALIQRMLETKIQIQNASFCLKDLPKNALYKEIEFLYPICRTEDIEGLTKEGDYLKGFIDLVFQFEGKYYLIDYKTNWLGQDASCYSELEKTMSLNQYFLQASIYRQALKKYLERFDLKPFGECFGGTLYWFVRGIQNENKGLFIF